MQLAGVLGQIEGKLRSSGVAGTDGLYVCVCVPPPMIVGVWSMAVMLWQLHEYYYCLTVVKSGKRYSGLKKMFLFS